jgi:lysophospholipase L1-like esterase
LSALRDAAGRTRAALLAAGLFGLVACSAGSAGPAGSAGGGGSPVGLDASAGHGGTPGTGGAAGSGGTASAGGGVTGGKGGAGGGGDAGLPGADGGAGDGKEAGTGGTGGTGAVAGFAPCPKKGAPCVIMPLGDSITFGYGSTTGGGYRADLFTAAVAANKSITFVGSLASGPAMLAGLPFPKGNEGHSGYSIDDSSQTMGISPLVDQALATYKPNIILLMIGTNDMHYSLDLANAPRRLGALIDRLTSDAPDALLVVAKIIPALGAQNTPTQAYNAAIPGVVQPRVAQGKHLVMVDLYAAIGAWSSAMYKDSEHPNDAGYSAMARTWYSAIQGSLP